MEVTMALGVMACIHLAEGGKLVSGRCLVEGCSCSAPRAVRQTADFVLEKSSAAETKEKGGRSWLGGWGTCSIQGRNTTRRAQTGAAGIYVQTVQLARAESIQ